MIRSIGLYIHFTVSSRSRKFAFFTPRGPYLVCFGRIFQVFGLCVRTWCVLAS